MASKYLMDEGEDEEIYNDDWARAADLDVKRINQLEKVLLHKLDWKLFVSESEFKLFSRELTKT